jgi:N,N'-diacetyllegionaminate synthase
MDGGVLFLIPARGGSKRVPRKNLRTVAGVPLVGRAALNAQEARRRVGGAGHLVCCTTDDPEVAQSAREWGAEVLFPRPPALSDDTASSVDVALHALDWLGSRGQRFGLLVLVQPTSPLTAPEDLAGAIDLFRRDRPPSVATVSPAEPPQWTHRFDGVRLRGSTLGAAAAAGGDVWVRLNGAAYVVAPETLRSARRFVDPDRSLGWLMPPERGVDVDTESDLLLCEVLLDRQARPTVRVGGSEVGPGARCFVIAEAGVNHGGDVAVAHRLVDAAVESGADAVKFQTFDPAALAAPDAPVAEYQRRASGSPHLQRAMLDALVLGPDAHRDLQRHAHQRGIEFLSTPFDEGSADFLDTLGVPAFKIASGEATNHAFLAHVASKGRPLLLSTGMCDMREVMQAVQVIRAAGDPPLALLHCVSRYPAAPEEANLAAIRTLQRACGVPVGFSDHTLGIEVALAAAAMGAEVVEKHLTLDRRLAGPDHAASLEPEEFRRMVDGIRSVEAARGSGTKAPAPSERLIAAVARRSLHWRVALDAGTRVDASHLVALRPGTGLPPSAVARLVGRHLREAVGMGAMVREEEIEGPAEPGRSDAARRSS